MTQLKDHTLKILCGGGGMLSSQYNMMCTRCSPSFIASGLSCFAFQSSERVKPAVFDGSDIVSQPGDAVFCLFHGVIFECNRPVVPQHQSHFAWLDRF